MTEMKPGSRRAERPLRNKVAISLDDGAYSDLIRESHASGYAVAIIARKAVEAGLPAVVSGRSEQT